MYLNPVNYLSEQIYNLGSPHSKGVIKFCIYLEMIFILVMAGCAYNLHYSDDAVNCLNVTCQKIETVCHISKIQQTEFILLNDGDLVNKPISTYVLYSDRYPNQKYLSNLESYERNPQFKCYHPPDMGPLNDCFAPECINELVGVIFFASFAMVGLVIPIFLFGLPY